MAAVSGSRSCHATLTGTTADTVTLTGCEEYVEVVNHHATETIYFTYVWTEDSNPAPTTAVALADETIAVLPGAASVFPARGPGIQLSVVGNGNIYSVQSF